MQFSDTSNRTGLIQDIEKWTNLGDAAISGDTTFLKQFTADVNNAYDEVLPIIFTNDSKWAWDDPNHLDQPRATTDIVSGQSTYPFVSDEDGNSVLELTSVYVKNSSGVWGKLSAIDTGSDRDTDEIDAGNSTNTGAITRYDKSGVSIILDPIPNYSSSGGLRASFARTPSYFVYTDTTKKPGIPALFHRLLSLIPSRDYVSIHKPEATALLANIQRQIAERKQELATFMAKRARDERTIMRVRQESSR